MADGEREAGAVREVLQSRFRDPLRPRPSAARRHLAGFGVAPSGSPTDSLGTHGVDAPGSWNTSGSSSTDSATETRLFTKGAAEGLNHDARVFPEGFNGFRTTKVARIALCPALGKLQEPDWITHRFG